VRCLLFYRHQDRNKMQILFMGLERGGKAFVEIERGCKAFVEIERGGKAFVEIIQQVSTRISGDKYYNK